MPRGEKNAERELRRWRTGPGTTNAPPVRRGIRPVLRGVRGDQRLRAAVARFAGAFFAAVLRAQALG